MQIHWYFSSLHGASKGNGLDVWGFSFHVSPSFLDLKRKLRFGKHGLQQFVPRSPGVGTRSNVVASFFMLPYWRIPSLFFEYLSISPIFWSLIKQKGEGMEQLQTSELQSHTYILRQLTQLMQISPYLRLIVSLWLTKSEVWESWTSAVLLVPSLTGGEILVVWTYDTMIKGLRL